MCIPSTSKNVIRAVSEAEKNLNTKITVFSFGDVQGCQNILEIVENTDESKAPKEIELDENEMKKDCVLVFWSSGTTGNS